MYSGIGKFYKEKEDYVNKTVAAYACPISNIESVRCARRVDNLYMEIVHEDSAVRYFDITDLDVSSIGIMVGCIMANLPINREIKDRKVKREIRKIFKMGEF